MTKKGKIYSPPQTVNFRIIQIHQWEIDQLFHKFFKVTEHNRFQQKKKKKDYMDMQTYE